MDYNITSSSSRPSSPVGTIDYSRNNDRQGTSSGPPISHATTTPVMTQHSLELYAQTGNHTSVRHSSPPSATTLTAISRVQATRNAPRSAAYQSLSALVRNSFDQLLLQHPKSTRTYQDNAFFLRENPVDQDQLKKTCGDIAYGIYRESIGSETQSLTEGQQTEFLRQLATIENDKCYVTAQSAIQKFGENRIGPLDALKDDEQAARKANFHIRRSDNVARPSNINISDGDVRVTLSLKPEYVIETSRKLTDYIGGEFDDFIRAFKVMGAKSQGRRTDNIIIYCTKSDPQRAQQLAEDIQARVPQAAWKTHSPPGMHPLLPGISYGEVTGGTSFGRSRARVVADAIATHLMEEKPLEQALQETLPLHRYSLANPALFNQS